MNIETAKKMRVGDEVVLKDCGLVSTIITSGLPLSGDALLFEVRNRYDGVIEVTNNEIEPFDVV